MKEKITVAVIGKSGQAAKIIELLKEITDVGLSYVYYPKSVKASPLPLTNDFNKILAVKAIIIASPTDTHAGYLKKLRDYSGYILVEKPAVSTKPETEEFKKYPAVWRQRIKINFNFQHSELAKILTDLIKSPLIGRPIFLDIKTSHGLAFSEKYRNSWRADSDKSLGVLELVGVHFINLALNLFGPVKNYRLDWTWHAKKKKKLPPDTVFLSLNMSGGIRVNLYHSYAGPAYNNLFLMGTNGYFSYDGKIADIYSPRGSFDLNGLFVSPPIAKTYKLDWTTLWRESLKDSLINFFSVVKKNGNFPLAMLETGLASMEPIFYLKK